MVQPTWLSTVSEPRLNTIKPPKRAVLRHGSLSLYLRGLLKNVGIPADDRYSAVYLHQYVTCKSASRRYHDGCLGTLGSSGATGRYLPMAIVAVPCQGDSHSALPSAAYSDRRCRQQPSAQRTRKQRTALPLAACGACGRPLRWRKIVPVVARSECRCLCHGCQPPVAPA